MVQISLGVKVFPISMNARYDLANIFTGGYIKKRTKPLELTCTNGTKCTYVQSR